MIQIIGNLEVLGRPIPHHDAALRPMRDALVHEILLRFAQGGELYVLRQLREGIGSWQLELPDGQRLCFRAAGERVVIKDAPRMGSVVRVLRSVDQCRTYLQDLKQDQELKAAA